MARRITVKRVLSGIPNISTLTTLVDVNDSALDATNAYLKYDSASGKFVFASLEAITTGVSTINSLTGNITLAGSGSVSVSGDDNTLTITGSGTDSSVVTSLIAATDLGDLNNVSSSSPSSGNFLKWSGSEWVPSATPTDSSTVSNLVDSGIAAASIGDLTDVSLVGISSGQVLKWNGASFAPANDDAIDSAVVSILIDSADTHDSAAVLGQINSTVNKAFVDALNVDAETLGGRDSSYFTNASNIVSGTLDSSHIPTLVLGADTTGNYVSDVSGTANEIEVSSSTGSVTIGLPSNVTIDSNLTVGGYIGGPAVFTIDPSAIGDSTGKVVILGDLQVDGVQTTINSTTVSISDKNIVLADSATDSSQANGAGITVNGANAKITYTAAGDKWVFNKTPYHNANRLLTTADDLHDSNAVQGQIDSAIPVTVTAAYVRPLARAAMVAGFNIAYDSATGVISSTSYEGIDSATSAAIADSRIGVASIGDLLDVDLTGITDDRILKWSGNKFIVALDATSSGGAGGGTDIITVDSAANTGFGTLSYNNVSAVFTYIGADSDDIKTVTGIPYSNLTDTPNILDSNHVDALIDSALAVFDTHDSAAVVGQINSALAVFDTHDSAAVVGQINNEVTISYINSLTGVLDADTLGGNDSSYYTNASNISSGTLNSDRLPTISLGTNTTGNYVVDISGTNNQIEVSHTPSAGSTPVIGLPSNVTIDSNLTVGGYIAGPANMVIDPATVGTDSGTLTILGNLVVEGETTTVNSTTVTISDKNIVLADSATNSAQANDAGITINGANATLQYKATGDKWEFNKAPYYLTERLLTTADDTHDEVAVQSQIDSALVNAGTLTDAIDSSHIPTLRTNDVNEGSNLYYTTARSDSDTRALVDSAYIRPFARAAIVAGTNVSYDSATGVISVATNFDTHDSDLVQGQIDSSLTAATQFLRSDQSDSMAGSLTIDDDLFVGGRIVSTSDSNISFGDNIIRVNGNANPAVAITSGNYGLEVERGSATNVQFVWNEDDDYWNLGNEELRTSGRIYFRNEFADSNAFPTPASSYEGMFIHDHAGNRALYAHSNAWHTLLDATHSTTDQLTEGSSNLYYNRTKVDSDVGALVNAAYVNALNVNADTVDSLQASQFLRSDSDDTMSANLTVTGTITTGSGSNTTVVDATDTNQYSVTHNLIGVTTSGSGAITIDQHAHNSTATSIEYVMHIVDTSNNKTQVTKVLSTYDGTNVEYTEYGQIYTSTNEMGTFAVTLDGAHLDLEFTRSASAGTVNVKIAKTVIV